jgi:hypothetical protein
MQHILHKYRLHTCHESAQNAPPHNVLSPIDLIGCDTSPSYNEVSYFSHYIYCNVCMLPMP